MKKYLAIAVLFLFIVSLTACGFEQTTTTTQPPVEAIVYDVSTIAEFKAMDMNKHYRLTADLDFENELFIPLGAYSNPFRGVLDGNNHTIKNVRIEQVVDGFSGLFTVVTGEIKQLNLENIVIDIQYDGLLYVGALAGYVSGKLSQVQVETTMTVVNHKSNTFVGAVSGFITAKISANTTATAFIPNLVQDIQATSQILVTSEQFLYVGGVAGKLYNSELFAMQVNTQIEATSNQSRVYIGGVVGHNYSGILQRFADVVENPNIGQKALFVQADLTASAKSYVSIGSIMGYNQWGFVEDGVVKGTITVLSDLAYVGGLVGENWSGSIVYFLSDITFTTPIAVTTDAIVGHQRDELTLNHLYYVHQGIASTFAQTVDFTVTDFDLFLRDELNFSEIHQAFALKVFE